MYALIEYPGDHDPFAANWPPLPGQYTECASEDDCRRDCYADMPTGTVREIYRILPSGQFRIVFRRTA